jgi:hypothetical protein
MNWYQCLPSAETLVEGAHYLLRLRRYDRRSPQFVQVKFVSLAPCPAVAIVEEPPKSRFPCERAMLYRYLDP